MTGIPFLQINQAALPVLPSLCREWLPAGKLIGHEFFVGDLRGSPGKSLKINVQTGEWADYATGEKGGDPVSLCAAIFHHNNQGAAAKDLAARLGVYTNGAFASGKRIVAEYKYENASGELVYQVVRFEPKDFRQRRPDGQGGWIWKMAGVQLVPYRLPKVIHAVKEKHSIYICEGEKGVHTIETLGMVGTCSPGGAGKWRPDDYNPTFGGANVVVLSDNDLPGQAHATDVARNLSGVASRVRVVTLPNLPPKGDVADWVAAGGTAEALEEIAASTPEFDVGANPQPEPESKSAESPLWHSEDDWSEAAIPPRPWIAKRYILRGSCTAVAGAGSAGKSSLMKAWAVALALGREYANFLADGPCRVLTYNVEDDLDEERMRLSAILRYFGAKPSDLKGKLRIVGPNDIGTLVVRDPSTGELQPTAAMDALKGMIEEFKPDVLMLDPLVELHTVEENDNTGVRAVMANFRALAKNHNLGLVVAHHTRKGATVPGDPDAIRGAGSIVGAVRVAMTVCPMSEEEAEKLGIPVASRRHYFRLDGAKANYAPLGEAEWFERHAYHLDNGEDVAAAIPWDPPIDALNDIIFDTIKAAISKGLDGEPYTFATQTSPRSLKQLCIHHGIMTFDGQRRVKDRLAAAKFETVKYKRKLDRRIASGIRTPDFLPADVQWVEDG
jgi:hypothetical protein